VRHLAGTTPSVIARNAGTRQSSRLGGRIAFLFALSAFLLGSACFTAQAQELHLVHVPIETKAQYVGLLERHLDIALVVPGKHVEIVATQEEINDLTKAGYQVITQVRDVSSHFAERAAAGFGGFKTFSHITAYLDTIHTDHPSITSAKFSIGTSIEGRDLWAIKVSDNPGTDETEPEVFYTGIHHAREPISAEVLLHTIDHLTDNYGSDPTVTDIVNGRELWFLPVMNPDGYVYNETTDPDGGGMWRKNRRNNGDGTYGVDPNRNYGYNWGYDDIGSSPVTSHQDYRGTGPFSEPENQAVRDFTEGREFSIAMNYHSYGNLLLYPWGYERIYAPDHLYLAAIADSATSFNGYAPSPGWGLYPTNGDADDWGYGEQTTKSLIFAFTPEVGSSADYFWPDASRIIPLCEENLPVNLLMAQIADNPRKLGSPVMAEMLTTSPVYADQYTVLWTHQDQYNPAENYELVEMTGMTRVTDDAESGSDNWALDGFSVSGARKYSGSSSFYSGSGDDLEATMTVVEHLDVGASDTLSMWCWYDIEANWDYAYVQASTDGGLTFSNLAGNITTNYDPNGSNRGEGITGSSGGWTEGLFPLDAYAGEQILVGVLYSTDAYVTEEGIYCDDIAPIEVFSSSTVLSSSIADTSYAVSGKSAGSYYYKVRAEDAEDQWSLWSKRGEVEVRDTPVPASSATTIAFAAAALALTALALRRRRSRV